MKKNLPLNEWLRVGNKDIKKKSQRSKKKKLEVRGGTCPLSTPPGSAPGYNDIWNLIQMQNSCVEDEKMGGGDVIFEAKGEWTKARMREWAKAVAALMDREA
jgi:hypothetical protein